MISIRIFIRSFLFAAALLLSSASALIPRKHKQQHAIVHQRTQHPLFMARPTLHKGKERSKRQERVGQLVQTELSQILHSGLIKGNQAEYLEADLRQRISVVNADVSPDLRQARISISVTASTNNNNADAAVDRRRAYSWLVRNTKPIRHTLAQRMSHIKTCPNLSFVQVDVAAAVDVMYLIDKVVAGYKRESTDVPSGVVGGIDFDEELDDDDFEEDFELRQGL